jgi:hypothetical protein
MHSFILSLRKQTDTKGETVHEREACDIFTRKFSIIQANLWKCPGKETGQGNRVSDPSCTGAGGEKAIAVLLGQQTKQELTVDENTVSCR